MPIDKEKILRKAAKMEAEDAADKPIRKSRKELWKTQTLEQSLYNEVGGKRIPRVSDIDQGDKHLNYVLKKHQLGDCYLLTNLMGLARTRPNFIMNSLIKLRDKDWIQVCFYELKEPHREEIKGNIVTQIIEPDSKYTTDFVVTKDEFLKWKTSHKAAWVPAVEIAYAKFLTQYKADNVHEVRDENSLHRAKSALNTGLSAEALTHLTGATTRIKDFRKVDTKDISKFKDKDYSDSVLRVYNKILKKLSENKIISVGFKGINMAVPSSLKQYTGLPKIDKSGVARGVIDLSREIKNKCFLQNFYSENKQKCDEFLKANNLTLEELSLASENVRKKFILATVDFEKAAKISKTKKGIAPAHAYLVMDAFEHEGFKYIMLKNPHDMKTKIDYQKSKKLSPEIKAKLPKVTPSGKIPEKNECIMELSHFYKKLEGIDYDK